MIEARHSEGPRKMTDGVLTMAFGSDTYVRMALGLARSIRRYNATMPLAIVSDRDNRSLRRWFDHIVPLNPDLGPGLAQKLHIDHYSPFERTLFIDADFLIFDTVRRLWDYFDPETPFGLFGRYLEPGETHYAIEDLPTCMSKLGLSRMVMTNTGVLYFDRSDAANKVFTTARSVAERAEALGIKRHPVGFFNDEPIFGVSVELVGLPIVDSTDAFTLGCFGTNGMGNIDVRRRESRHSMLGDDVQPPAIHFNVASQSSRVYDRELRRLEFGRWLGRTPLPDLVTSAIWWRRTRRIGGAPLMAPLVRSVGNRLKRFPPARGVAAAVRDRLTLSAYLRLTQPNWDEILDWIVRHSSRPFFVIQIGSNDGRADDPLFRTLTDPLLQVNGILVEPVPQIYAKLTANYQAKSGLHLLNAAVADEDGVREFFWVPPEPGDPEWVDQLGSFNRDVILAHSPAVARLKDRIQRLEVPCKTLRLLVGEYRFDRIDFLHIDAEGYDFEILKTIDFAASWAPRHILYEQKHLGDERDDAKAFLRQADYRVVDLGFDVLAYRQGSR